MIVRAKVKGLSCYCDTHRFDAGTVLVSLFGSRNAVRSCWAVFFDRKRHPMVEVGHQSAFRDEDAGYTTISSPLGRGLLHTIIVRIDATCQASAFRKMFYQVGPDCSTRYFDRLSHMCPVPFRPSWAPEIWNLGQEHGVISLIPGFGREVAKIQTTSEVWAPIIRNALSTGRLS